MTDAAPASKHPQLTVLCQLFHPELVSTGQTLTELCEQLSEMGMDVDVYCGPPTVVDRGSPVPRELEHRGITIRRLWGLRLPKNFLPARLLNQLTFAFSALLRMLRQPPARPVLVLTNPPFLALACAVANLLRGVRYIYLVFDVYPETAVNLGVVRGGGVIDRLWRLANRVMYARADKIVVIGACMRARLQAVLPQKHHAKLVQTHVWSDDIAIGEQTDETNPYLDKWDLRGKFVVMYSGNMGRFHDLESILDAAVMLRDRPEIVFLFVGEGFKKRLVRSRMASENLTNCRLDTYVPKQDLHLSLACADVGLVSLLEGQEGLSVPSKTFGIMAAGVPVVALVPHGSEIAAVVEESGAGIVTPAGDAVALKDALIKLYDEPQTAKTMAVNARRAIDEKYNLRHAARVYYELVVSLGP